MKIKISTIENCLVTDDHTSEGFLVVLRNGNIMHFFRIAPGIAGDHSSNGTKIVKRTFDVTTKEWSSPVAIYESIYDARNVHGGTTENGRIVLFFRRYNYTTDTHIDLDFMYSDDDGNSWSSVSTISTTTNKPLPYGKMIDLYDNPNTAKRYMKGVHSNDDKVVGVLFSEDGSSWGNEVLAVNEAVNKASETDFVYLGSGKIIGLVRDEERTSGSNYWQVTSNDYGQTWSSLTRTNICFPYFTPGALIFLHNETVIVLATDRRSVSSGGLLSYEGLHIYTCHKDTAFSSAVSYENKGKITRPLINSAINTYGYPTIAPLNRSKYLVVFTDRTTDASNEAAYLYQFYLSLIEDNIVIGGKYYFPVFPKM